MTVPGNAGAAYGRTFVSWIPFLEIDKSPGMTSEDKALLEILIKNETTLIDPNSKKTPGRLEHLLGPTFFEFGCSGKIWERSETIKGLLSTDFPNY
jgi:hypothetical protein